MKQLIEWVKSLLGRQQPTTVEPTPSETISNGGASKTTSSPTAQEATPPAEIKEPEASESENNTASSVTETREEKPLIVEDSSDLEEGSTQNSESVVEEKSDLSSQLNLEPLSSESKKETSSSEGEELPPSEEK